MKQTTECYQLSVKVSMLTFSKLFKYIQIKNTTLWKEKNKNGSVLCCILLFLVSKNSILSITLKIQLPSCYKYGSVSSVSIDLKYIQINTYFHLLTCYTPHQFWIMVIQMLFKFISTDSTF